MSSDSSDNEDLEYLREATDHEFLHNSLFNKEKGESKFEINTEKQVLNSLRNSKNEEEQFNLFLVTPEFRGYVAKQLSSILDKKLETFKKSTDIHENIAPQRRGGVRLFADSEDYIELDQNDSKQILKNCSQKRPSSSAFTQRNSLRQPSHEELKQLAISTEDILNQKEVKYWSSRSKAHIFHYKKDKSGVLVSLD